MSPSAWATPAVRLRRRPAGPAPIHATTGGSSPSPSVAPAIAAPSPAPLCDRPVLLPLATPRAGVRSHPLPPLCGSACGYRSPVSPCPCLLSTGDEDWSADRTELSATRSYEVTPAGPFCVRRAAVLTQAIPTLGRHPDNEPARRTWPRVTLSPDCPRFASDLSSVCPDDPLVLTS